MKSKHRHEILNGIYFFLFNFATPVVFYIAFQELGAKPAIAFAIVSTVIQGIAHWINKKRPSPFFIVASGFTVLFGIIDLLIQSPRFFRFEPFAQNFLIATVFVISIYTKWPILAYFAHSLPDRVRPKIGPDLENYLRRLTWVWAIYLYAKAAVFLVLAYQVDLGNLIVLRSIIGGGSLVVMFAGEWAYRKWIRKPSPR